MSWDTDCRLCSGLGRTEDPDHHLRNANVSASFRGLALHRCCQFDAERALKELDRFSMSRSDGALRHRADGHVASPYLLDVWTVLGLIEHHTVQATVAASHADAERPDPAEVPRYTAALEEGLMARRRAQVRVNVAEAATVFGARVSRQLAR